MQIDPDNGGTFVVRFGDSSRVTLTVEMNCVTAVSRQVTQLHCLYFVTNNNMLTKHIKVSVVCGVL